MTDKELRNQELNRHEEKVDRNIEHHQTVNLHEKYRASKLQIRTPLSPASLISSTSSLGY